MMDNSSGRMLALFVMAALFLSGCQMSTTNKEQQSADEQIENQNTGCDSEALACMPGKQILNLKLKMKPPLMK